MKKSLNSRKRNQEEQLNSSKIMKKSYVSRITQGIEHRTCIDPVISASYL